MVVGLLLVGLAALASFVLATGTVGLATAATTATVPIVREQRIARHGTHPSPWQAKVAYPVLVGRTAAIRRINLTLRGRAKATVAGFVHELPKGSLPKGIPGARSTIETSVQTDLVTSKVVAFTEDTSTFPAGAAHGVALVTTDTFNALTGARWHLTGLFRPGVRFLAFLSRESRALLRRQLSASVDPKVMLDAGTTPQLVNFQGWAVTPFGLQLTFSSYQVGPYVVGTPSVLIPFAPLARLARPGAPLALAAADHPARTPLLPATRPPAVDECWKTALRTEAFPPPVCDDNRVNVAAWDAYASFGSRLLRLGPAARATAVVGAACADEVRLKNPAAVRAAERLAAGYYGWHFLTSPLADFPGACHRRR